MGDRASRDIGAARVQPMNWPVAVFLLCLRQWDSHGYELMERSSEFGLGAVNTPTTYRTLRQMEKEGVIESGWETPKGGPARRVYSITDAGIDTLHSWSESLKGYQRTTESFLQSYSDGPHRQR